jgi:plasmid stabilization system protein ParE
MDVEFHPEAIIELREATQYYETQQNHLGERFLVTAEETITRISSFPAMYQRVEGNIRQCKIARFPYAIVYRIQLNFIQVIAVAHLRKNPRYWLHRK